MEILSFAVKSADIEMRGSRTYHGRVAKKLLCGGRPMTAIVLAGGRGERMKADKAWLPVGDTTLLKRVVEQLRPSFDEVLVSVSPGRAADIRPLFASPSGRASVRTVEDDEPGLGPLGGILAGLRAAANETCAVVACDIPDIPLALLRRLAQAAEGAEIAVPVGPTGLREPLFAVYRKCLVPAIESLLAAGERSVLPFLDRCRTSLVRMRGKDGLRNLNTRQEYLAYVASLEGPGPGERASPARGRNDSRGRRRDRAIKHPAGRSSHKKGSGRRPLPRG